MREGDERKRGGEKAREGMRGEGRKERRGEEGEERNYCYDDFGFSLDDDR